MFLLKDDKRTKEIYQMLIGKKATESITTLSQVMMPHHASHYGNVHGGIIMRLDPCSSAHSSNPGREKKM